MTGKRQIAWHYYKGKSSNTLELATQHLDEKKTFYYSTFWILKHVPILAIQQLLTKCHMKTTWNDLFPF